MAIHTLQYRGIPHQLQSHDQRQKFSRGLCVAFSASRARNFSKQCRLTSSPRSSERVAGRQAVQAQSGRHGRPARARLESEAWSGRQSPRTRARSRSAHHRHHSRSGNAGMQSTAVVPRARLKFFGNAGHCSPRAGAAGTLHCEHTRAVVSRRVRARTRGRFRRMRGQARGVACRLGGFFKTTTPPLLFFFGSQLAFSVGEPPHTFAGTARVCARERGG